MTRHMPCSCCGGTGSCRTDRMSKAGKSARAITSIRIWRRSGSISKLPPTRSLNSRRNAMILRAGLWAAGLGAALAASVITAAVADEEPKRGRALTYMIPADGPPSFDGHREATYATVHSAAPYYSVLIRVNPDNPGSASDFVCDLCTAMPQPTDGGKTYTFKIRDGVKFHDGSPLTAYDVAESWRKIVDPPEGVTSARQSFYVMIDKIETPDPRTMVFRLKFPTSAFLPALADPFTWIYKKEILDKDPAARQCGQRGGRNGNRVQPSRRAMRMGLRRCVARPG